MGGGLMQLVAYGAQDIYLTGNAQITFFKVVYRRHTNFAMETIEQTVEGTSTLGTSVSKGTVVISRNGDLVGKVWVSSDTALIEDGDSLINTVELQIGGQMIDKHYKEWLQIWAELTVPAGKRLAYKNMTGALSHGLNSTGTAGVNMVQVPLCFFFNRNPGLSLPLIALQYHEVKLIFEWGTSTNVGAAASVRVWCDYVYLDTDERRRFAQVSHEYLIEHVQRNELTNTTSNTLTFNHPVKELIWTSPATNAYVNAKLQLNGHDRFTAQQPEYFQLRQPFCHHTSVPGANVPQFDRPVMLSTPLSAGPYNLQALAGDDATNVTTTCSTDDDACMGVLSSLTADGAVTESGDGLFTLIIREASADQTYNVGDIVQLRITALDEDTADVDVWSVQTFQVTAVRVGTISSKTYTELTLDRNPLTNALATGGALTLTADDKLIINIIGRVQDPLSDCSQLTSKINCYSFALKPEEHQPSGTCNFSRIDTAKLIFNTAPGANFNCYAICYNVLRIMSGMGGLAYSN
jgi:hypothetical protein